MESNRIYISSFVLLITVLLVCTILTITPGSVLINVNGSSEDGNIVAINDPTGGDEDGNIVARDDPIGGDEDGNIVARDDPIGGD